VNREEKTAVRKIPFESRRPDDALAMGGHVTVCYEGGETVEVEPLVPAIGDVVTVRVSYRCGKCGKDVGEVREFFAEHTGELACLFEGRIYRRVMTRWWV
jgi:hypothetical protein